MEVGLPTCQIQESSTPESHVQMMRNMSKFWIKLGQVLKHSLSQTALGPLLSYSLWLKGLWLKAGTTVLMVLSHPLFLLGFSFPLYPLLSSSLLFALCPSDSHTSWKNIPRTMHQLTHQGLPRMGADIALDVTWRDSGHMWDLFHRTSASSPRENC